MAEEISKEDMGDKLLDATRNDYKAQINNIWHIIHRVELTDEEGDEVFTCMAWIEEDLENFHCGFFIENPRNRKGISK